MTHLGGGYQRVTWRRRSSKHAKHATGNFLRLIAWNLSLAAIGAATAAAIGEGYLRATKPFMTPHYPYVNVPGVGTMFKPGSVVRHTNKLDFWTTTPINRWGFADREPLPTARTEESCHIAVVGDSFVEALEVPIAAKMHVQLEQLAASELPHLDVTTSAFGRSDTGQAAQLAYYDKYVARLKPKLVVLVFILNDFANNYYGPPWRTRVVEAADGTLKLLPPDPESMPSHPRGRRSYLLAWLDAKHIRLRGRAEARLRNRAKRERATPLDPPGNLHATRFALQHFAVRAERDNASLVILSERLSHVDRAGALRSAAGDIPIVAFHDYMVARGRTSKDRRWDHDYHWNPDGHRWAAQAVLEYLRTNQAICRQA